ncbi:MAG: thiamine pyrophosphate-dependent enzyme [Atribacterota bacterium]|jgi:pyruvate ferredoxin oxidoreductase beta subunit|nr:thiamine pyrophosphate-dependent enzyme [Atribacterota bacterium]MDD5497540.1 thiamine pyrophosphate-dependent enzyme [Atribacterota bacterium]
MAKIKELAKKRDILSPGHRLCAGCGASIAVRQILSASDDPVVVANATGCLEVATTIYPYTSWRSSFIHNAFENAAATISGVETMYQSLKKQGKIDKEIKFIAFGGDGGTYDIGLQSLSGALERGHDFVYVCYDNEAYMNTGIQRSSATPRGAWTTTSPCGKVIPGKTQYRKDLTGVVAAHKIPYVAQATLWRWNDLIDKAHKAFYTKGPAFLNILSPCPRGWRFPSEDTIKMTKLAVQTNFWPLYEVENGKWKLNYKPKERLPITEWMEPQGRYKHLLTPENKHLVEEIQQEIDENWERLLILCGEK